MTTCFRVLAACLIILLILVFNNSLSVAQNITSISSNRVIVKFKQNTATWQKENIHQRHNLRPDKEISRINAEVIKVSNQSLEQAISKLVQEEDIEFVEPDYKAEALDVDNDPLFSQQWAITKIQADKAWSTVAGKSPAAVAIVDTGINQNNPDLVGKVISRTNFTSDPDTDGNGHGTHVAGIVAAAINNGVGIAGVSNGNLISVKVLDNNGSGFYSDVANGIIWAADNGARVINLSLGGPASSRALQEAVDYAWGKGAVVVVAAGNSNSKAPFYPAYYTNAIAVAATDQNDQKAAFSNYGASWVDVAAPGVGILSTYGNDYKVLSGTSMASPHVAGVASLIFSNHPDWTNAHVRAKIESSGDGSSTYWAFGRINACKAVDCTNSTGIDPTPTPTPSPIPSPLPLLVQGFNGEYFNNQNLTGIPVFTRIDPVINFDWGYGSPAKSISVSKFSIRWTATITPQTSQNYTFTTVTDDGVRLLIDNNLIIDDWHNQRATTNKGIIFLNANQTYNLKMEYFEYTGKAQAKLSW